jgi:hypothetical protein
MRRGFVKEAAVVGLSTVVVAGAIELVLRALGVSQKTPWYLKAFATGVVAHVAWEKTGGNAWFAENYPNTLPPGTPKRLALPPFEAEV